MYAPLGTTAVMQDCIAKNTQKGPEIKLESFFLVVKVKRLAHEASTGIFYLKRLWPGHYLLLHIHSYSESWRQLFGHPHHDQHVNGDQSAHLANLIWELSSINNKRGSRAGQREQVCHWGYQVGQSFIESRLQQLQKALQHVHAS